MAQEEPWLLQLATVNDSEDEDKDHTGDGKKLEGEE
jgi:hypothetical protein